MTGERDGAGSPMLRWLDAQIKNYEPFLRYIIQKFRMIPDFEGSGLIGDDDVDDLVELCNTFDVDINAVIQDIQDNKGNLAYIKIPMDKPSEELLYDKRIFMAVKGRVGKEIKLILNETLKPEHWER